LGIQQDVLRQIKGFIWVMLTLTKKANQQLII
jgi:hypothetical protein